LYPPIWFLPAPSPPRTNFARRFHFFLHHDKLRLAGILTASFLHPHSLHSNLDEYSSVRFRPRKAASRQADQSGTRVSTTEQTRIFPAPSILLRCSHMRPQPQEKVGRADRIEGSIVLFRSAARSQVKPQRPLSRGEPWWNMVFGVPLFLRTLLRLVFVCPHRHKGPPVTLRESIPSSLSGSRPVSGRGSYITCLDCGQKFAYDHRTGHLVDFWGVHDREALAGVRRRLEGLFSFLRGLAGRGGKLNRRTQMSQRVKSVHRLGILTKGQ
jgi:hypothetical protein